MSMVAVTKLRHLLENDLIYILLFFFNLKCRISLNTNCILSEYHDVSKFTSSNSCSVVLLVDFFARKMTRAVVEEWLPYLQCWT